MSRHWPSNITSNVYLYDSDSDNISILFLFFFFVFFRIYTTYLLERLFFVGLS